MFKWLHRYFTTQRHDVGSVQVKLSLYAEEYPRGHFQLYYKEPGDISLSVDSHDDEVEAVYYRGSELTGEWLDHVEWRDVTIDFGGWCKAPSAKRLQEALSHVTFFAWYQGGR